MNLPPNSIIVSGPVIIEKRDGKLQTLLNKHKKNEKHPNPKWQFCGGTMEDFNETLEQTAKREVKEEMGIEIENLKLIDVLLTKRDNGSMAVLVHYLADRVGEVTPGEDIDDWGWFPVDELPDDVAPNVRPMLEKAKTMN